MSEEKYLSFSLTVEVEAMIETSRLSEIVYLEDSNILPLFALPPAVMGVFNLRGEIVWLIDLAFLLGLQPLCNQTYLQNYNVIVMKQESKLIGLACQQVGKLFIAQQLRLAAVSESNLSANFDLCVQNKAMTTSKNSLWVLDFQQILNLINK